MIGKGFRVNIYDEFVSIARLVGANKEYIQKEIPHVSTLMRSSVDELLRDSDVIVVSNASEEFKEPLKRATRPGQVVIDLVRITGPQDVRGDYHGICW
jgi:GDP-mannose 6-dehydrogenase